MELFEYDNHFDERINSYKCNFFHMYLEGKTPINNSGTFNKVSLRDYASFIHEYVHYIQQITTPYGLKYSSFFNNKYILYREAINLKEEIHLPIKIDEIIEPANRMEEELGKKNGCLFFNKGNIDDIEVNPQNIKTAKEQDTAVNIAVYDFENNRIFEEGFKFGYWCIIESMAHMVQSLVNPDLYHSKVPYQSVQLICNKIRPDIKDNIKLLISVCYISLYFNNPGCAFFEVLKSIPERGENGVELYRRYMRDYSRTFRGKEMPNYRMMHILMNEFVDKLGALVGNQLAYYKDVFNGCKRESSKGDSFFLNMLYNGNIDTIDDLCKVLNYYGYPAIDSCNDNIVVPYNFAINKPYIETASLISLELLINRFEEKKGNKTCLRFPICNRNRENENVEESCIEKQWMKEKACLFKSGLKYWQWQNKRFI